MIDLNTASIDIRKAAWMKGVKSGKVDFHFDRDENDRDTTICKVYNRNFPDGIEITGSDLDTARQYSFSEIKQLF